MKRDRLRINTVFLFVFLQTILYITFLSFDITGSRISLSSHIKFSMIILCFCYVLLFSRGAFKSILFCMKAGLAFTVISDLFLLLLDNHYNYGVISFIVVQQLYSMRLILTDEYVIKGSVRKAELGKGKEIADGAGRFPVRRWTSRILIQAAAAFTVCLLLAAMGVTPEMLLVISVFYFICILTNTVTAIRQAVQNPHIRSSVLFAAGMGSFLMCDINVGLFNLSGFITLPSNIYHLVYAVSSILMWTFYAPSQVLIALSTSKTDQ